MKEYLRNHNNVTMFLSTWVSFPICILLVHNMTIPVMPWHLCFKLVFPMLGFCSVVFFLLGWMTDGMNRQTLKEEFLRKLES